MMTFSYDNSAVGFNSNKHSGNVVDYSINFANQKISEQSSPYSEEITSTIKTGLNNPILFKASNVLAYEEGWQSILPGGYFYNPIDESINHNKITGISSISFNSKDSTSLTLCYGYSLDNIHINYSHEVMLNSNELFTFNNDKPNYIYLKNNNNYVVNIDEFFIDYTCSDTGYSNQTLTVLMIGNSFADDTLFYANRVASSYGVTLNIFDAYIAGCTINQHYNNLNENKSTYSMRSMKNGSWVYNDNMSLTDIINSHTWDIITFQQASAEVGRHDSYSNLSNLVNSVRSLVGSTPKFYWHETWAYDKDYHDYYDYFAYFENDQDLMFSKIIECYEDKVAPLGLFEKMVPAGTAVQNLRTSYMKDTITRDGKHMSSVHGRYLLALNMVSHLFNINLDLSPCLYKPNEVSNSFINLANEAIRNAYKAPLEVTNSVYTSKDLGEYDLTEYTEIDAELVGCSYWNSTDSANFNKRVSNAKDTSNLYTSTKRFTPYTLPIGSLVVIDEAFGVRPEAWASDSVQSTRPGETYQKVIEINSSFWNGYEYRAFNIFKAGKTELKGQYDQIFDGFHIYVPNSVLGTLKPKGFNDRYDDDNNTFINNGYNINAFERMHLDPITGFYKCDSYYDLTNSYVDDTAKKFMCSRPFYSDYGDLAENTVIVVDSGYQWRSDCWGDYGTHSRPGNISATFTKLDSSFWSSLRRRTFNVSSTSNGYVNQNYIEFFNHMRIYKCIDPDHMELERKDGVTMNVLGYATLNEMAASTYGKSDIPIQIIVTGDISLNTVVRVDGFNMSCDNQKYDKNSCEISIKTMGYIGGTSFSIGTIKGIVDKNNETIYNVSIDGSISSFVDNNGHISLSSIWFDRCNYSSNAASQTVWQRRYMYNNSWQYNYGSGDWTTTSSSYHMEEERSMGLRIANSSYYQTAFLLKSDFNNGEGIKPHGISIWLFNPNGNIYSLFRIYGYKSKSTPDSGYVRPNGAAQLLETKSLASGSWQRYVATLDGNTTIYNISLFFQTNNSNTTYVYLGHVSIY